MVDLAACAPAAACEPYPAARAALQAAAASASAGSPATQAALLLPSPLQRTIQQATYGAVLAQACSQPSSCLNSPAF